MAKKGSYSFDSAAAAPAPKASAKKGGLEEITLDGPTADYAATDAVYGMIETMMKTLHVEMKTKAIIHLIDSGIVAKAKPENFIAVEDGHSVTCILSKRRVNSYLNEEEQTLLKKHNIPFGNEEVTLDAFLFDPAVIADPAMRKKIEKVIGDAGLGHAILHQQGETKYFVNDDTLAAVFQQPKAVCTQLLNVVTTFSLKAKFNIVAGNIEPLLKRVGRLLGISMATAAAAAAEKKTKKAA